MIGGIVLEKLHLPNNGGNVKSRLGVVKLLIWFLEISHHLTPAWPSLTVPCPTQHLSLCIAAVLIFSQVSTHTIRMLLLKLLRAPVRSALAHAYVISCESVNKRLNDGLLDVSVRKLMMLVRCFHKHCCCWLSRDDGIPVMILLVVCNHLLDEVSPPGSTRVLIGSPFPNTDDVPWVIKRKLLLDFSLPLYLLTKHWVLLFDMLIFIFVSWWSWEGSKRQ